MTCTEHSIKCRVNVLKNMMKYRVHPVHRYTLLYNLNKMREKVMNGRS